MTTIQEAEWAVLDAKEKLRLAKRNLEELRQNSWQAQVKNLKRGAVFTFAYEDGTRWSVPFMKYDDKNDTVSYAAWHTNWTEEEFLEEFSGWNHIEKLDIILEGEV